VPDIEGALRPGDETTCAFSRVRDECAAPMEE
jgi:hypothetical protein